MLPHLLLVSAYLGDLAGLGLHAGDERVLFPLHVLAETGVTRLVDLLRQLLVLAETCGEYSENFEIGTVKSACMELIGTMKICSL